MDTVELIRCAKQGDKAARNLVVTENVGLVWSIVKRFMNRGYETEDLFQIGSIGLLKAIDHFDLSFDVKFSTYAVPMIMGEIKRFLRDDGMVKVSRTLKENGWKVRKAAEKLGQELGREATLEEISKEIQLSVEEIVVAMEANGEVESIYKSVYQNDGNEIYLVDQIADKENEKEAVLNKMLLDQLLKELDETERKLITLRYYEEKTQVQVAEALNISQVQVSRLEKKILLKLRKRA